MLMGNAGLARVALKMLRAGRLLSMLDTVYWFVVALKLAARHTDVRYFQGVDAEGKALDARGVAARCGGIGIEGGQVLFRYKDYQDADQWKTASLPGVEFIGRFLLHVLPLRLRHIRHSASWARAWPPRSSSGFAAC